jgi:O-antigen/teichoic acid export membrane protein
VLWRLLFPEAFGIMAIVNVFLSGLQMFSDVGIGPSIVQSKRGTEPDYLNTAWTIQVVRGAAIFVCALIVANPVAEFYREPLLSQLIPAVALASVISGFNSTRLFTTTRELGVARLQLVELSAQLGGLLIMVGLASVFRSVWALVLGGLVQAGLKATLSHALLSGNRDQLRWDKPSATELLRFGRWIFLSTMLTFATLNADRLIFGKLIPLSLLGVYSIGTMWASFPMAALDQVFRSVVFPVLSRVGEAPREFDEAYRTARLPWLLVGGWACVCLLAGGPSLIRFLYDERATAAGWIIQVLAVSTWFLCLESAHSSALLARGKSQWLAAGSAAKLAGMLVCIPVGLHLGGFPGAICGYAASELLRFLVYLIGVLRLRVRVLAQDLGLTLVVAATGCVGWLIASSAHAALNQWPHSSARFGAVLEGIAVLVVVSVAFGLLYLKTRSTRHAPVVRVG